MSKAANPPIKPPSTQELSVFANIRSTTAPIMSTNATAAALINTDSFLLYHDSRKRPLNLALLYRQARQRRGYQIRGNSSSGNRGTQGKRCGYVHNPSQGIA